MSIPRISFSLLLPIVELALWAVLVPTGAGLTYYRLYRAARGSQGVRIHSGQFELTVPRGGWVGFALLSHRLAGVLGRAPLWPRFIAVWNWCNVVQYLMLVVAGLPALLGLPELLAQTVWLVAMGWALWLEWYATRLALAIPGRSAMALVALDFALGVFLLAITGTAG